VEGRKGKEGRPQEGIGWPNLQFSLSDTTDTVKQSQVCTISAEKYTSAIKLNILLQYKLHPYQGNLFTQALSARCGRHGIPQTQGATLQRQLGHYSWCALFPVGLGGPGSLNRLNCHWCSILVMF